MHIFGSFSGFSVFEFLLVLVLIFDHLINGFSLLHNFLYFLLYKFQFFPQRSNDVVLVLILCISFSILSRFSWLCAWISVSIFVFRFIDIMSFILPLEPCLKSSRRLFFSIFKILAFVVFGLVENRCLKSGQLKRLRLSPNSFIIVRFFVWHLKNSLFDLVYLFNYLVKYGLRVIGFLIYEYIRHPLSNKLKRFKIIFVFV